MALRSPNRIIGRVILVAVLLASAPALGAPVPPGGVTHVPLPVGGNASGFVAPGSKIDVIAVMRTGAKLEAFPAVVDVLVFAVDVDENQKITITVAATDKQARAL